MAKGKKRGGSPQPNNGKKDYIEAQKQKALEKKKAEEEKKAAEELEAKEQAKQEAIANMTEEEKLLYMSQEEVLQREKKAAEKEASLEAKEKAIEVREKALDDKSVSIAHREDKVSQREASAKEREAQISDKEKALESARAAHEKKVGQLATQERSLIEREANAQAGFTTQNLAALESLKREKASLEVAIEKLKLQKIEAEQAVDSEISSLRATKLAQLDKEMANYSRDRRTAADAEAKELVANARETIKSEKESISDQRAALLAERKALNTQRIEQEKQQSNLDAALSDLEVREGILEEDIRDQERKVEGEVEKRIAKTNYEVRQLKLDLERTRALLTSAQEELAQYREKDRMVNGLSIADVARERDDARADVVRLTEELAKRPSGVRFAEYQAKAEHYDEMARELHNAQAQIAQYEVAESKWMDMNAQLARARSECTVYEKMIEAKQAILDKYSEEVNRLRSLYEQPKELAAREETIKMPVFMRNPFSEATAEITESAWLDMISAKCDQSGIKFGKRLLYAFHTALKTAGWSPLTVLAGVSGTGKSLLPEYYSRYGGIYFMSMAVQPDWDSPQSLFGYFNSVDNRFNATPLLQAMVQFRPDQKDLDTNLSDSMIIVLLDEMNLAHVELYFSDMLSKLERCRNTDDQICVDIDLGAGMKKYQLPLSDNVLWVGTMNEDETTKSLSDKVLDRGNLISFPRPRVFESRHSTKGVAASDMLRRDRWKSWLEENVIEDDVFAKMITEYKTGLEQINIALSFAGRALGHRVWQAVENYMANHPLVIAACKKETIDEQLVKKCMTAAFEEALVYKVMPKLRGIETDGTIRIQTIDEIARILFAEGTGLAPGLQSDFKKAIDNPYETFIWNSADYLEDEEIFK